METVAFDTHAFVKRLTNAGMPEPQAEILAEEQSRLIAEQLATKRDLRDMEARLNAKIETESAAVRSDMKAESAAVRGDMKAESAAVRGELRLVKWMLALVIAATVIPLIREFL